MIIGVKLLGLATALVLAQGLAATLLPAFLRPDLVLALALALGLGSRGTGGLVLAFGLGYAVDVLSGSPPGLHALLRGTACGATRLWDRVLYLRAPAPWALYVGCYALFDVILMAIVLRLTQGEVAISWMQLAIRAPLSALLTSLAAAPLFAPFRRLSPDAETDEVLLAGVRGSKL